MLNGAPASPQSSEMSRPASPSSVARRSHSVIAKPRGSSASALAPARGSIELITDLTVSLRYRSSSVSAYCVTAPSGLTGPAVGVDLAVHRALARPRPAPLWSAALQERAGALDVVGV